MNKIVSKTIGRPVSFDRSSTVQAAKDLYWHSGVAKTSFNTAARVLNVSKPTLYRYFGDEDGLLSEALQLYVEKQDRNEDLLSASGDLRTDLNAWFSAEIDEMYQRHADNAVPSGCLLMECWQLGKALGDKTTKTLHQAINYKLEIFRKRLLAAKVDHQLSPGIDLTAAVHLLAGQIIVAKNVILIGVPKKDLQQMVALAIDGIVA